jgi:hypothetical protein
MLYSIDSLEAKYYADGEDAYSMKKPLSEAAIIEVLFFIKSTILQKLIFLIFMIGFPCFFDLIMFTFHNILLQKG